MGHEFLKGSLEWELLNRFVGQCVPSSSLHAFLNPVLSVFFLKVCCIVVQTMLTLSIYGVIMQLQL